MKIITLNSLKGGVGKTTLLYAITNELTKQKKKLLLIDLDSQCNTSKLYDNEYNSKSNVYNMFSNKELNQNIIKINNNVDLIPGDIRVAFLNNELINVMQRELILMKILKQTEKEYDYILIDTHPDLSIVTVNALIVSDLIISPINPNSFSFQSIELLSHQWNNIIKEIGLEDNLYFVLNNIKHNTSTSRELTESIKEVKEKKFKTTIPSLEVFNKITINQNKLEDYKGTEKAQESIEELVKEIKSILK
jgi:chromosome partitioning protein